MSLPGSGAVQNSSKEHYLRQTVINMHLLTTKLAIELPPLSVQAELDLKAAAEEADKATATSWHKRIHDRVNTVASEPRRLQGEIGEVLARKNISNGEQLDPYSRGKNNFPNYDVAGDQEMCQVKTRSLKRDGTVFSNRSVFERLFDPNSTGNLRAAERLLEIKKQQPERWAKLSPHLPPNVRKANSQKAMQTALADVATLRVPQDQVKKNQADFREFVSSNPELFGLEPNANPHDRAAQIEQIVQARVLSIDERFATIHYTQEAKKLWHSRELDAEKLERRNAKQKVSEGPTSKETTAPGKSSEKTPKTSKSKEQEYSHGYGY